MSSTWISIGGAAVGVVYGVFGVGACFATPMLALLGVAPMAAVVGPLPALLPGAMAGAWSYSRRGNVDWVVARWAIAGGFPAVLAGAYVGTKVGGPVLLVLSGVVLLGVGLRILRPGSISDASRAQAASRRASVAFVVVTAVAVGFASGLLANGGGFLLVPMFLLVLGFEMHEASGTSLVVATALSVPTLVVHLAVGDLDTTVALAFALGLVPGAIVGARLAMRLPTERVRGALGGLLVILAVWFLWREVDVVGRVFAG